MFRLDQEVNKRQENCVRIQLGRTTLFHHVIWKLLILLPTLLPKLSCCRNIRGRCFGYDYKSKSLSMSARTLPLSPVREVQYGRPNTSRTEITPDKPVDDDNERPRIEKQRFSPPEKDKERDRKRRKTHHVLDRDDKLTMDRNIILHLESLVGFIETNFVCRHCRKTLTVGEYGQAQPPFFVEVYGLVSGINFQCMCGARGSLRPKMVPDSTEKVISVADGEPYTNRVNSGDFEINKRLQLGLQLCGSGRRDSAILAGMLKLNVNPMHARWTKVQESLAKATIKVGSEVLEENLHIECLLSPAGMDGPLDVANDTGWDKRGSTRRYDLLSGCSVAFGLRSNLPIGI
jgi:hypothetical protein